MEQWRCQQCTFLNYHDLERCELCNWAPVLSEKASSEEVFTSCTAPTVHDDSVHLTCIRCSFRNDVNAMECSMCGDTEVFANNIIVTVVKCQHCQISFPTSVDSNEKLNRRSKVFDCPNCGDGSRRSRRNFSALNPGSHFQTVTEGIIELITGVLGNSDQALSSSLSAKKITTEYALCSPCPHVSQRGNDAYEWSCGYRNIQMICHSLLLHSENEHYKTKLFNGKGDIPDIDGLQSWIEKAWGAGFDVAGGEEFGGKLLGTDHWIGATECVALLRFFGIRAIVVDFSMNQEEIIKRKAVSKSLYEDRIRKKKRKQNEANDAYYPGKNEKKNKKNKSNVTKDDLFDEGDTHDDDDDDDDDDDFEPYNSQDFADQAGIRSAKSLSNDIVILDSDDDDIDLEGIKVLGSSSHQNIIIKHVNLEPEKFSKSPEKKEIQKTKSTTMKLNKMKSRGKEMKSSGKEEEEEEEKCSDMGEKLFSWVKRYHSQNRIITAAGGAVTDSKIVSTSKNNFFDLSMADDLTDEKDLNSEDEDLEGVCGNGTGKGKICGSFALPLFFQHQGYEISSTGTEIEKQREIERKRIEFGRTSGSARNDTCNNNNNGNNKNNKSIERAVKNENMENKGDRTESLLVFDPLSDGFTIKRSLLEGSAGWKKQLKRGQHTLNKNSYQIVYIARGIMTEEERERSKVIVGQSDVTHLLSEIP